MTFPVSAFQCNDIKHQNRHRESPALPATPPDLRVRIRRFGRIELRINEQPGNSKRVRGCTGTQAALGITRPRLLGDHPKPAIVRWPKTLAPTREISLGWHG